MIASPMLKESASSLSNSPRNTMIATPRNARTTPAACQAVTARPRCAQSRRRIITLDVV
jgi:hypothetical protein